MMLKYAMPLPGHVIEIPNMAQGPVRHVGEQDGFHFMWVEAQPDAPKLTRVFCTCATGTKFPEGFNYRGTVQQPPFVWHLLEHD